MFTGLVEGVGTIATSMDQGASRRMTVRPPAEFARPSGGLAATGIQIGESIAINGCCLTVVDISAEGWAFDLGDETLARTNLGAVGVGDAVNLERALAVTARLGGHFVQGHIDGRGEITRLETSLEWTHVTIRIPAELARYVVPKGSIAVDGVSLTVVSLEGDSFRVMLIPHTLTSTTLGLRKTGDAVNIEVDLLAKYVERLLVSRPS